MNKIEKQGEKIIELILENEKLKEENKKLKIQLYSDDQIVTKCPRCGKEYIINECRVVWELKSRINKAVDFINDKDNYFEDGENWNNIKKVLDILKGGYNG